MSRKEEGSPSQRHDENIGVRKLVSNIVRCPGDFGDANYN